MSEHLKALLATAKSVLSNREIPLELRALSASFYLIEYLEAQESEKSSSEATETPEETKLTWSISFKSWFHANQDGTLTLFPSSGIWDLINSQLTVGGGQVEAILSMPTRKGETPPSGSLSPSTEEQTRAVSGVAGDVAKSGSSESSRWTKTLKVGNCGLGYPHEPHINYEWGEEMWCDPRPASTPVSPSYVEDFGHEYHRDWWYRGSSNRVAGDVADSGSAKSGSSESSSVPVDKLEALIEEWETWGYKEHHDWWDHGLAAGFQTAAEMLRELLPASVEEVEG